MALVLTAVTHTALIPQRQGTALQRCGQSCTNLFCAHHDYVKLLFTAREELLRGYVYLKRVSLDRHC